MIILYGSIPASLHDLHIFWEEESASFIVSKGINGEICKPLWLIVLHDKTNEEFKILPHDDNDRSPNINTDYES
jgi:hypothetical protein